MPRKFLNLSKSLKGNFLAYAQQKIHKCEQAGYPYPWLTKERLVLMFDEWVGRKLTVDDMGFVDEAIKETRRRWKNYWNEYITKRQRNEEERKELLFEHVFCQAEWVGRRLHFEPKTEVVLADYSADFISEFKSADGNKTTNITKKKAS